MESCRGWIPPSSRATSTSWPIEQPRKQFGKGINDKGNINNISKLRSHTVLKPRNQHLVTKRTTKWTTKKTTKRTTKKPTKKQQREQPKKQRKQCRRRVDDRRDLADITKLRLDSWILRPAPRDQESNVERESTVKKWHIKVEDRVYQSIWTDQEHYRYGILIVDGMTYV